MTPNPTPPDQGPDVSPTGKPLVSPKLAPYFAAGAAVCAVIAGASQIPGLHLPPEVFGYATLLALIFGTLLGTTPGIRGKVPLVLLVLGIGLGSSCAHAQAPSVLQVTGETLDAAGALFEATLAGMESANQQHLLTQAQLDGWNGFVARWTEGYRVSAEAWKAAAAKGDEPAEQQAAAALGSLMGELGVFSAMLAKPKPGGGP
jgi:hypothetical protein